MMAQIGFRKAVWPQAIFLSLLFASAHGVAIADETEGSDKQPIQELFLGEIPNPQESGEVQVALGGSYFSGNEADVAEAFLSLELGITGRFQVGLTIPIVNRRPNRVSADDDPEAATLGIGDVEAEFLYAVIDRDQLVVAVALEIGFPTGDEGRELGEGKFEWEPSLRGAVEIGETWLFAAVGAEIAEDAETAITYGAALARPMGFGFAGVLEVNGSTGGEKELLFLVPGLAWRPATDIELRLGVPIGLTREAPDWGLVAAITASF